MATRKPANDTTDLPPGVTGADTKYPEYGKWVGTKDLEALGLDYRSGWPGHFTFYKTERFGWVLLTLHISNPSRRAPAGTTARSYGIAVSDGAVCTVGSGPHVLREVTVYLTDDNRERLSRYVDLWKRGMADAGSIRDRISSRRAATALRRGGLPGWF